MKILHETDACAQQRSRTRDDRWTKTPQKIADGKPRWELSTKNCSMMKCMDQNNTNSPPYDSKKMSKKIKIEYLGPLRFKTVLSTLICRMSQK